FGCLDTLAVDHCSTRLTFAPEGRTNLKPQAIIDPLDRAISHPLVKVVGDMLPVRQIVGQHAPLATRAVQVQDGVHYLTEIDGAFATWPGGLAQPRFDLCPFVVRQIA